MGSIAKLAQRLIDRLNHAMTAQNQFSPYIRITRSDARRLVDILKLIAGEATTYIPPR